MDVLELSHPKDALGEKAAGTDWETERDGTTVSVSHLERTPVRHDSLAGPGPRTPSTPDLPTRGSYNILERWGMEA